MKIKLASQKIIYTLIPVMVILLIWNFYLYYHPDSKKPDFRCPETYTTDDEYTAALRSYFNEEIANNHDITAEELTIKRYEVLVANNCTTALQNLINHLPAGSGKTKDDIIKNEMRSYSTPE